MIEKKCWLVVTFHTTAGAMAMERICRNLGIPGRLIPVPRSITAGCGMAWRAEPCCKARIEAVLQEVDSEGIYELEF